MSGQVISSMNQRILHVGVSFSNIQNARERIKAEQVFDLGPVAVKCPQGIQVKTLRRHILLNSTHVPSSL